MPIPLLDNALQKSESEPKSKKTGRRFRWDIAPLETNAGAVLSSFENEGSENWVVLTEAEAQTGQEQWPVNYYAFFMSPTGEILLIRDNDTGVGGKVTVGGNIVIADNFVVGGSLVSGYQLSTPANLPPGIFVGVSRGLPVALEQRLEHLRQLPEGWDSYGAHQVSDKAITKAKLILQRASTIIGFGFLKESFISPCTDGGLEIESDLASGKELFLDIAPTGESITFLLVETTPEGEEKEKEGEIQEIEDLDKLLRRASN